MNAPRERYEQQCAPAGAELERREQRHMREVGPVCRPLRANYLAGHPAGPISMTKLENIRLGDLVRDRVSGRTGIVVSLLIHIHGCTRCGLQPTRSKGWVLPETLWVDSPQLTVVCRQAVPRSLDKALLNSIGLAET